MDYSVLVPVLLPLFDQSGDRQPRSALAEVREVMLSKFGGLTAHTRAPAEGTWEGPSGHTARDDIVVFEVVCTELDLAWGADLRTRLERLFRQDRIVVRAQVVQLL